MSVAPERAARREPQPKATRPLVMKFGGSSVADAACMREVGGLVSAAFDRAPLVVLSAMGKTTNALFAAARAAERGDVAERRRVQDEIVRAHRTAAGELFDGRVPAGLARDLDVLFAELDRQLDGVALLKELSPRSMDSIAALGERLATAVFAAWFGAPCFDVRTVIVTDARHGSAEPDRAAIARLARERLQPLLRPGSAVVTQGYVGATAAGVTTTLGRGGSDYSAALLGEALDAVEVQIWTDVEGVLTCDPRIVPAAQPIMELSFAEAAELAAFGAKVLHPATIQPAVLARVPVTVRHTRKPTGSFTRITGEVKTGRAVTALAARGPVSVLTVTSSRMLNQSGFLGKLFDVFGRHRVSVDVVATAEVSVSATVEADVDLAPLVAELSGFATVDVHADRAIVAVVGERLKHTTGLAARIFAALADVNVEMISMGANEINLSLVVRRADAERALQTLHAALFENGAREP